MKYVQTIKSELLGATIYTAPTVNNDNYKQDGINLIAFYGGIFSQWAECKIFIPELDIFVNCAEQAMMLHKAKTFNDTEMFDNILNTNHPRDQKMYGRMVSGFDVKVWNECCEKFVTEINYHKFSQNRAWKELLVLTNGFELVEASPTDKIWGVGMVEDDVRIANRANWLGENKLGECIMKARAMIVSHPDLNVVC